MSKPDKPSEFHITVASAGSVAVELLADAADLPKQQVKQAMQKGAAWLTRQGYTKRIRRSKRALQVGDQLHLYYNPKVLQAAPPQARLIADEQAYSIWYKPYGMLSQGSKWGDHCTINRFAEQQLAPQRPVFIVHRLDRAASGLMLLAHQKRTARLLAKLFEQQDIEKRYRAIVHGRMASDHLTIESPIENRSACSHVHLLTYDEAADRSLLEIAIETGRKHQIRRHLSREGLPIVGDRLYGTADDQEDLQLASVYLGFICPLTGQPRSYELPLHLQPKLSF